MRVLGEKIEGEGTVLYPIFLNLDGKRCVVVGGGAVANQKARKLLQARAEVVAISPEVKPELESVAAEVHRRPYREGDLEGAFLVFAATNHREVNAAVTREARGRDIPVIVADVPAEGDFALPSVLRRGQLQVAVSTGGASPTLAQRIRYELESTFGSEWAGVVDELGRARRDGNRGEEKLEEVVEECLSRLRG